MDTTSTTVAGGEDVYRSGYVSCIKVDGEPILPPIMTEERRVEMRRYKELALLKEKQLGERRDAQRHASMPMPSTPKSTGENADPASTTASGKQLAQTENNHRSTHTRSVSTSPTPGVPTTSTPRAVRVAPVAFTGKSSDEPELENLSPMDKCSTNVSNENEYISVPDGVLRERNLTAPLQDPNQLLNAESPVSPVVLKEYTIANESDDSISGSNLPSSAPSSTGTFVIRRSEDGNKLRQDDTHSMEKHTTSEEELDNAPSTVLRKPSLEEPIFKRKRPAKYFDIDENVPDKDGTPKCTYTFDSIPNSIPQDHTLTGKTNSRGMLQFSPVANVNFTSMAERLTKAFTQKFGTVILAHQDHPGVPKYEGSQSRNAQSLVKTPDSGSDGYLSNGSDKENVNITGGSTSDKKHVRKLSYTLATPSAALLEAVSKDRYFAQTLETVPSAPGSVGIASATQTPEKQVGWRYNSRNDADSEPLHTREVKGESESKQDRVSVTLSKLQNLNLGLGKQAHLERFLGEQEAKERDASAFNSGVNNPNVESILRQMQFEHESKLQRLVENHRLQEMRIRQEFESEIEKLKERLNSTLNTTASSKSTTKTSPLIDSMNSSRSPRPATAASTTGSILLSEETVNNSKVISSGMSGISFSDQTKHGNGSVFQFTGSSRNTYIEMSSNATVTGFGGGTDLSAVGLSKLQSKMQLMSPSLFRVPADARSPLLKGLVFPNPLDKPQRPIRIPPKVFDASMKVKFEKISAAVKGYLTRRLLQTDKVQIIVQTIRDTVDLLLKLYEEAPIIDNKNMVKPQDVDLHQRLIQQLKGACQSFHDVFFKLSTKERMALIATDREKLKAKAMRTMGSSPSRRPISNATLKSLERRMSHRSSPKRDGRKSRVFDPQMHGSQSVKPKPIKTFNISPKRRRISYWDDRNMIRRSDTSLAAKQDMMNGNKSRAGLDSARSQGSASSRSNRNYHASNNGSETFLVPESISGGRAGIGVAYNTKSSLGRREVFNSKSISARNSVSSSSTFLISNVARPKTASSARQPWNNVRH